MSGTDVHFRTCPLCEATCGLEITVTEGRNRQVRRMLESLGAAVLKLVRVKIGSIAIGTLQIGKWRLLTDREVRTLRAEHPQP